MAGSLQEQKRRAEIKKQYEALRKEMLLTTSNSFEGYDIVEYCGIKSDSVVLGTGFLSEISASLIQKIIVWLRKWKKLRKQYKSRNGV